MPPSPPPEGFHVGEEVVQQNAPAAWSLDTLPPGYRFTPKDEELISFYLRNKIHGLPLPINRIHAVNLYDYNPEELAARHEQWGEGKWFFFTPRDRKYRNGSRPSRSAGDGYWKATGADKPVKRNGVQVGVRKALVFYRGKPPHGHKTEWIMHEYRIDDAKGPRKYDGTMKLDDWVLCVIHEKARDIVHAKGPYGDQDPRNQREGGKKKQGKEAKLQQALLTLENSADVGMMHLSLHNNNYHYQSYDNIGYPPLDSINHERFLEPKFLQEMENGRHSPLIGYWPHADDLEYSIQDVHNYDHEVWAGDINHLLSNSLDDCKFHTAYHPFGYDVLPTTNLMDSSGFSSCGPNVIATSETGASGEDFVSGVVLDDLDIFNTKMKLADEEGLLDWHFSTPESLSKL